MLNIFEHNIFFHDRKEGIKRKLRNKIALEKCRQGFILTTNVNPLKVFKYTLGLLHLLQIKRIPVTMAAIMKSSKNISKGKSLGFPSTQNHVIKCSKANVK